MIELVVIVALFWLSYRLRRVSRRRELSPSIRVDVYHHFPGGPGLPEVPPLREEKPGNNVMVFRKREAA